MLIDHIVPENDCIICRPVKYLTYTKRDDKDNGDQYYEVVSKQDPERPPGTLLRYNTALIRETEIEGEVFAVLIKSQIEFKIPKEHVKADILKR